MISFWRIDIRHADICYQHVLTVKSAVATQSLIQFHLKFTLLELRNCFDKLFHQGITL